MLGVLGLLTLCSLIPSHNAISQEKKVITLNTALLFSTPNKQQRREGVLRGIIRLDPDVVCLQEVYDSSDVDWLKTNLRNKFPESVSFRRTLVNKTTNGPLCQDKNFFAFLQCIRNKCSSFNTSNEDGIVEGIRCLITECALYMFSMPQECLSCFFLYSDFTAVMNMCMKTDTKINAAGLLLLSKNRMSKTQVVEHHPHVVEVAKQGYLTSYIDTVGTVICTHLAARFLKDLYPEVSLPYGSYVTQNVAEVRNILNISMNINPLILLGDFNTSPQLLDKNVCEENPESYKLLTNPNNNLRHTILNNCTYCMDNTWTNVNCNLILDHIFFRGFTLKEMKRVYDDRTVTLNRTKYHTSDHYGIMATFIVD